MPTQSNQKQSSNLVNAGHNSGNTGKKGGKFDPKISREGKDMYGSNKANNSGSPS
jgi:hypothetical protein